MDTVGSIMFYSRSDDKDFLSDYDNFCQHTFGIRMMNIRLISLYKIWINLQDFNPGVLIENIFYEKNQTFSKLFQEFDEDQKNLFNQNVSFYMG